MPTATARPSPNTAGAQTPTPGATPTGAATPTVTGTPGVGANQTPASSPVPPNDQIDQSGKGTNQSGATFPYTSLMIGLSCVILLGSLLLLAWSILRRRLLPMSSSKLLASGAVPWNRTRVSDTQEQVAQWAQWGAMRQRNSFSQPGNDVYNAPYVAPYTETTMPNTDPYNYAGDSQAESFVDAQPAFQEQEPAELSADVTVLSDPYFRSMIEQYSQRGQSKKQPPAESL